MSKTYSLEQAMQVQSVLRSAAGLEPERFPIQAFVGMISDEIEVLRKRGKNDDEIAELIRQKCNVDISSADITANYAPPGERNQHHS